MILGEAAGIVAAAAETEIATAADGEGQTHDQGHVQDLALGAGVPRADPAAVQGAGLGGQRLLGVEVVVVAPGPGAVAVAAGVARGAEALTRSNKLRGMTGVGVVLKIEDTDVSHCPDAYPD